MGTVRRGPVSPTARRTIGVLSPVVGGFYFGALIAGVARAARAAGHRVVAVQTYPAGLDRERYPDESILDAPVALGAVDGLVVVGKALRADRLAAVQQWGVPLVLVSEEPTGPDDPVVVPDNTGGVRAAVEHLLEHGHTQVGFVGCLTQRDMRERFAAYRAALADHGIDAQETWWFDATDNHEQGGADAAARMLAVGRPTTAVVAATDRNAIGFQRALRAAGLALPRDQAVVGFDHADSGARVTPRLSTVDAHYDRVGETAVSLLLARMRGEDVAGGEYRAPSTLVLRESCGCTEVGQLTPLELPRAGVGGGHQALRALAETAFVGPAGAGTGRRAGSAPRETWWHAVVEPLDAAAERGALPVPAALARLADLTAAMQPHPEALEQLVTCLRAVESATLEALPDETHHTAVRRTVTEVLLALTKGCTRAMLARSGQLERTIVDQYEVDMDLLRGDGASPRALGWLPRGVRGHACLALWLGGDRGPGDRELEIVGVHDTSGTLSRLVGMRTTASQFPPAALTRAGTIGSNELTFVVPVTFGGSDWGLLAIDGAAETRATSARDRFNHWAALLAVALDQERLLTSLREQRRALEQAAARERSLADTVRASEERYALASMAAHDGTWDWDVSAGTVYYSPRWKQTLGYDDEVIGDSPAEWLERVHPADRDDLSAAIASQLAGAGTPLELEHRVRTSSGDYRWMLCRAVTVLDDAGCPARLVGALVDVTERKEAELALQRDALHDPETGLVNRLLFLDRLASALLRTRRSPTYDCAVVLVRVLEEQVIPTQGRHDGEPDVHLDLHRELVRRLRRPLREGDTPARIAEDDFAVLLDDVGPGGVPGRVGQLLDQLRHELGSRIRVGALGSIRGFRDVSDVLREVDIALLRGGSTTWHEARPGSVLR
ncbi:substrate-binding domain-containing protein [Cellulomonas fimi]|uniref:Diguanylate cyclase with PAS/PAC sensor n=1 Tax=Cellulomonas fimi (strain ATCC 484 / DSM 20113 / JCM 1341 / CCUG 24087 / LMG 16345 / NBRC 15513 / NCIMB 8980 / NCTC 7547 / NRS-133) TaxID=590998 RepID=F4GZL3_CELFA|nr:substrate-binding domain-containing protein [Cellulomonas fimi]AEE46057.1 diguanylate cyclase with PAS/PAC sensor [Cellulomonas fimi ATCC 484]NNH06908.1 substrate-binding domain-containing protein [Cellulomonas fimi]VEH31457.1 Glucose-resistance amylase regulator [Cellulomonas fimi]